MEDWHVEIIAARITSKAEVQRFSIADISDFELADLRAQERDARSLRTYVRTYVRMAARGVG